MVEAIFVREQGTLGEVKVIKERFFCKTEFCYKGVPDKKDLWDRKSAFDLCHCFFENFSLDHNEIANANKYT